MGVKLDFQKMLTDKIWNFFSAFFSDSNPLPPQYVSNDVILIFLRKLYDPLAFAYPLPPGF